MRVDEKIHFALAVIWVIAKDEPRQAIREQYAGIMRQLLQINRAIMGADTTGGGNDAEA